MSKPNHLVIVNAWGNNRGDEAMLRALIYGVRQELPNTMVSVFSNAPMSLPTNTTRFPWSALPFQRLLHKGKGPSAAVHIAPSLIHELRRQQAGTHQVDAILRTCDMILSAPAGPYIGEMYPVTEPSCLLSIWLARHYQKPCAIAATSAGPFAKPLRNAIRRTALAHVQWWTLREPHSYTAVESLNLAQTDIELVRDLVFAYPITTEQHSTSPYEQALMADLYQYLKHPTIGVTLNTTPYIDPTGRQHPFDPQTYAHELAAFLQQVVQLSNAQLLFFSHHYGSDRELQIIRTVINHLGAAVQVRVVPPDLNSDGQQLLAAHLTLQISHRYHPTIFALQHGVPVFCIIHQFKAEGLLRYFDYPLPMPTTLTPVAEWLAYFEPVWEQREALRDHIRHALPMVRKQAQRTIERVVHTLQNPAR